MKKVSSTLPRVFWGSVIAAFLCSSLSLIWILVHPDSHTLAIQLSGILGSLVIGLIGRKSRDHRHVSPRVRLVQRWIPVVFLLNILCPCFAIFIGGYYLVILHQPFPTPSLADVFAFLSYVIAVVYFSLLPTTRLPDNGFIRRMLDDLLILGNCILFGWYFILGPVLLNSAVTPLLKITASIYPIGTLVIIYFFLRMARRTSDASMRPAILLFACSLLIGSVSTSIYGYVSMLHEYTLGGLLDIGLQITYLLFGLATLALRTARPRELVENGTRSSVVLAQKNRPLISSTFITFLPYFLLIITIILIIYCWWNKANGMREDVIYFLSLFLVILSFLRQIVFMHDITTYARTTARLNQALAEANVRLKVLSTTDPLTKLLNHGALIACLEHEIEHAILYKYQLSILFFDADHFKHVNDFYGHSVGDAVLQELGNRIQATLREGDIIGRYGGEEFVALLPQTDLTQACDIAERLRQEVATHPLAMGLVEHGLNTTISIGVATFPIDGQTANEMLEQADQAMYRAKQSGRNQVWTALQNKYTKRDSPLAATIE